MLDVEKITWGSLLRQVKQALEVGGIPEVRHNALWLLGDVLGCSPAHLMAYPERLATPEETTALAAMLARRLQHEPVQYIVGYADFFGLRLSVSPAVLIPRPETEQVVETALALLAGHERPRVLDIGTGSGCIALALARECPDALVYACDVSTAALAVAHVNAEAHGLTVAFLQADVLASDFPDQMPGSFDFIISNPPYIAEDEATELDPEVHDYEPHLALFAGGDPLVFYRAIARHASSLLVSGGEIVFETHAYHTDAVERLLKESGFIDVEGRYDLSGRPRIVSARRIL